MPGGIPDTSPRFSLDWSPKKNFWDKVGGLPKYIASVATALIQDRGFDRGRAIATAKNRVEHWCATGHDNNLKGNPPVSKAVQAAACGAIAEWKEKLARAKTKNLLSEEEISLLAQEFEPFVCPTHFGEDEEGALELEELLNRIKSPEFDAENPDFRPETPENDAKEPEKPQELPETLIERITGLFQELQAATVDAVGRVWRGSDHPRGAGGTFSPKAGGEEPTNRAEVIKNLIGQMDLGDLSKWRGQLLQAALQAAQTGEIDTRAFSSMPDALQQQAVEVVASVLEQAGLKKKEASQNMAELAEEFTDKPWNGSASRFADTNDYCRSCLIDENGPNEEKSQSKCHLPIREPNGGAINKAALRAAAARLNQVKAQEESKARARQRLSSLMSKAGMNTNLSETLYQLPIELSEPTQREGLWRKALVPVGKKILKKGKPLDFSRQTLERMVDNFKAKAYDQVPLLNGHTDSVDAYLGELVDLELDNQWLWGVFKPSQKGSQILKENPKLPTSVGYWEDYTRPSDGKNFGPTLQHVAALFRPHVPGLAPWEPIQLSDEAKVVVDLTEAEFASSESADTPREERDPVSEVVDTKSGEREEVEVTLEERLSQLEQQLEEEKNAREEEVQAREAEKQAREASDAKERRTHETLRRQGIRKMLNEEYVAHGVPPAKANAAFALLSAEDGLVTLSEDGEAAVADSEHAKAVTELLEGYKGTLKLGEEGTSEDTEELDEETRLDKRTQVLMAEKSISYAQALDIALLEEEVK